MGLALTGNPLAHTALQAVSKAQRRIQVPDADLRAAVTPDYELGCKRVLFTSTWFPALRHRAVALVTAPIAQITARGVLTSDGVEHPVDLLVLSTGFAATDLLAPMRLRGAGRRLLSQVWADGAHAYLGMTVPGFPNLFLMYGPNTNTGNTSVVYFQEAQARYLAQAARLLAANRGGALEVRENVEAAYDEEIQSRPARSVWAGCANWYTAASGRIVTNWPGMAGEYARRTARFDVTDYVVTPPPS